MTPADSASSVSSSCPPWARWAIAWHVFPLGFVGAPALRPQGNPDDPHSPAGQMAAEHRLRRLIPWLDELIDLGCNLLVLGPVLDSMSHGYDTRDFFRVDPRLGTQEDLVDLIDAAHERGIRVMLDGVFNHVGRDFPRFASLVHDGPQDPSGAWFHVSWPEDWRPGTEPNYRRFEGQDWLPELNHDCPEVEDLVVDVMTYWCEHGVDAWRLDAAYAVAPEFFARVLRRVRQSVPELYVVGEMIHGDYADYCARATLSSVTQYELWKALWSSVQSSNMYELEWTLRRHQELLTQMVPWTFVSNHDTTRIASQVGPDHLGHVTALWMCLPGLPALYYGDEVGLQAVKEERLGGDDAIRPEFCAVSDRLTPHGRARDARGIQPGIDGVRSLYQALISLRRRHSWLYDADYEVLSVDNPSLSVALQPRQTAGEAHGASAARAGERKAPGTGGASDAEAQESTLVCALNLSDDATWLPTAGAEHVLLAGSGHGELTHEGSRHAPWVGVGTSTPPHCEGGGVHLPAHTWAILSTVPA